MKTAIKTVHDVLVEGRNLIDSEGWLQESLHRPGEGYCMTGAIIVGVHDVYPRTVDDAIEALADAAPFHTERLFGGIDLVRWNNTPGRTKDEVLAVFDRAIATTAPRPDPDLVTDDAPEPQPVAVPA